MMWKCMRMQSHRTGTPSGISRGQKTISGKQFGPKPMGIQTLNQSRITMLGKKGEMVEHPLRVELEGACRALSHSETTTAFLFFLFFLIAGKQGYPWPDGSDNCIRVTAGGDPRAAEACRIVDAKRNSITGVRFHANDMQPEGGGCNLETAWVQ